MWNFDGYTGLRSKDRNNSRDVKCYAEKKNRLSTGAIAACLCRTVSERGDSLVGHAGHELLLSLQVIAVYIAFVAECCDALNTALMAPRLEKAPKNPNRILPVALYSVHARPGYPRYAAALIPLYQ